MGVNFSAKTVLRAGVALLGVRITFDQVAKLGWGAGLVVILALVLTVVFGQLLAQWFNRPRAQGLLSGGSVAICGASAASGLSRACLVLAIAAVGVKTSFENLLPLGWQPGVMLVAETVFIAIFVLIAIVLLGLGA